MSINKFITLFGKNKPFSGVARPENPGFWIFELLVSIVILMFITLFLFRFSCNMIALEADSVNRLMAIDYIASQLDAASSKNPYLAGALRDPGPVSGLIGGKSENFEFKSQVSSINIAKSNLPDYMKNGGNSSKNATESNSFNVLRVSVSYKSAFGKENVVKVFAGRPNSGVLS